MNATDQMLMIRKLPPNNTRAVFYIIAENLYSARLQNGDHLSEIIDVVRWLKELGDLSASTEVSVSAERSTGLKVTSNGNGLPPAPQNRNWENTCHGCGHVHQGECEMEMGGGRKCGCRMEVRA
ncbi:MAG TPA: hypothetical protein VGG46_03885 [Terriglobales bacterium]